MGAMWGVPPSGASRGRRAGVWCVALLAGLALPVGAADPHGGHAEAKPFAKPAAKPEHKPVESAAPHKVEGKADNAAEAASLEALRQRLQGKLADGHGSTPVAKVTNSAGHGSTPRRPAAKKLAAVDPHAAGPAVSHAAAAPAAAQGGHGGHGVHWSYSGEGGPAVWGGIQPEFATCGLGNRQSPIDIRGGIRVDLEPIRFDYRPSSFGVIDNGHTVQANVGGGNSIEVGGRRYELLQFHFHRPSEERINGRQFDMVAHLVHKDPEGRLAVVAVMLEQGRQQPAIQMVWNSLPLEKNMEVSAPAPLDMNLLLPEDRRYYTYMGSLTTPPCSEGVLWLVLKQPVPLSPEQVGIFARLYPMNARPIQPGSGRLIKESN